MWTEEFLINKNIDVNEIWVNLLWKLHDSNNK